MQTLKCIFFSFCLSKLDLLLFRIPQKEIVYIRSILCSSYFTYVEPALFNTSINKIPQKYIKYYKYNSIIGTEFYMIRKKTITEPLMGISLSLIARLSVNYKMEKRKILSKIDNACLSHPALHATHCCKHCLLIQ